ncbi:MAG: hypothetical protein ACKO6Q_03600 [Bacteroidota bacterium]
MKIESVENSRFFVTCAMQLLEVTTPALANTFLKVNPLLQGNDPHYIRPLDKDVAEVFDPQKNKAFRFGEVTRWVLFNDQQAPIGRIAAFVNKKYRNKSDEMPVGGIGFFDCIHDQTAADMLFDVAKHWLMQRGMEAMDGPINFGERDRWWGLIVEGFQSPLYGMNYNPPYYQELFERYGFKNFFNQLCFGLDPRKELSQKILDRHSMVAKDPNFRAGYLRKKDWQKYAMDFMNVYNKAWAGHAGMKELRKEQVLSLFKKMMPVVEEKIVWFAYYKNEPIALFLNLPDLNQWFRHLNGQFGIWQKLKFLWIKKTKPNPRFTGIAFGIVPEFQGKGIDSYLINEAKKVIQPLNRYETYELQWIGEFNPKMLNVATGIGDTFLTRKLITYRYIFDRTRPFQSHPIL